MADSQSLYTQAQKNIEPAFVRDKIGKIYYLIANKALKLLPMKGCPLPLSLLQISTLFCLVVSHPTVAQIVPDATLPNNSTVQLQGTTNIIEGGTPVGGNLFHSFQEFSVPTGGEAFFNNALNVQNIFSRVTGSSISNIDGLIRANGTANLFLLNPNGIIFGRNARLNIGGSFLASTATSLQFADGTFFSTVPSPTTPLLTVSVPVGLQIGSNPGRITVQGPGQNVVAQALLGTLEQVQTFISAEQTLLNDATGLQVQPGRTLALVGGEVTLEGGLLKAPEGRLELGSVAGSALVSLNAVNEGWTLGYEGVPTFGDIQLSQRSLLTTSGNGGGNIQLRGSRITLTDESGMMSNTFGNQNGLGISIQAEQLSIRNGSTISVDTYGIGSGGTLTVNASQSVELVGTAADGRTFSSLVANTFGPGAAGSLTITTGRLTAQGGAGVQANTAFGQGKGGTLTVNASESVELSGTTANGQNPSNITVYSRGSGTGGNLTINTGTLRVQDGALVSAATFGEGQGGNIFVNTTDSVELSGSSVDGRAFSALITDTQGSGVGGNLTLTTGRLLIQDGAFIAARTFNSGAAGNLNINATDSIELIGTSADGNNASSLTTATFGSGNAGNLTIQTGRLSLLNGAAVSAETFGDGNGGNILVQATDLVEVVGTRPNGVWTRVFAGITEGNNPNRFGGNLTIETGTLSVRDGGRVSTEIYQPGNGGNIQIEARDLVEVIGFGPPLPNSTFGLNSSISSGVTQSVGNGGNITIETRTLSLRDGGAVSSGVFGQGNGGDIQVRASERVEVLGTMNIGLGSNLTTTLGGNSAGKSGNLSIDTQVVSIRDGGNVATETFGQGDAGQLQIRATELVEVVGEGPPIPNLAGYENGGLSSRLSSSVSLDAVGNGGTLTIEAGTLSIRDGGQVQAVLFGSGKGGDIQVRASNLVEVVGAGSVRTVESDYFPNIEGIPIPNTTRNSSTLSTQVGRPNGEQGGNINQGGNITINTQVLSVHDGGIVSSSVFDRGNAGNIEIAASNQVDIIGFASGGNNSQLSSDALLGEGKGGNITVKTQRLILQEGANISASTSGNGNAGTISLQASESVELSGDSDIFAVTNSIDAFTLSTFGRGGNVRIETGRLYLTQDSTISALTSTQGTGGEIVVQARESVQLYNGSRLSVFTLGAGDAGSISVTAPEVELAGDFTAEDGRVRGSGFSANSEGSGVAGNLNIKAGRLIVRDGALVQAGTFEAGKGGTLTVTADEVVLSGIGTDGTFSGLYASSEGSGAAGNLNINAGRLIVRDGAVVSVSGIGSGDAGDLNITAGSVELDNDGFLGATTTAGTQGNITVQSNSLILRRASNITTNATGEATGGNITLNTGVLAALENSDISANAQQAAGGRVIINAQAIFGAQPRTRAELQTLLGTDNLDPNQLPTSDITAISQQGGPELQGTVQISTPDVDPSSGLIELPTNLIDGANQFVPECPTGTRFADNEFFITGRGGIPPAPRELLGNNAIGVGWVTLNSQEQRRGGTEAQPHLQPVSGEPRREVGGEIKKKEPPTEIVEAQGWIIGAKGEVILTATAPTPHSTWHRPADCSVLQSTSGRRAN